MGGKSFPPLPLLWSLESLEPGYLTPAQCHSPPSSLAKRGRGKGTRRDGRDGRRERRGERRQGRRTRGKGEEGSKEEERGRANKKTVTSPWPIGDKLGLVILVDPKTSSWGQGTWEWLSRTQCQRTFYPATY